jgi:hypothetical protein
MALTSAPFGLGSYKHVMAIKFDAFALGFTLGLRDILA